MEENKNYDHQKVGLIMGHGTIINTCPCTGSVKLPKTLYIERLREDVVLPEITDGNAGIDLRVLTEDGNSVTILPNDIYKFRTGIKVQLPEGYYIDIAPRSSAGCKKTLRLMNTLGIIDNNYRGELLCFVHNFGKEPVEVLNNERLVQMIIRKDEVRDFSIKEIDKVSETDRGSNGFGSTGRI